MDDTTNKYTTASKEKGPLKVLSECRALLIKKSQDYQNPASNVKQAMHYRRGIDTLHDTLQGKLYRAQSLIESGDNANFESLEDTYKDIVNYAAFCVAWLRGEIEGQDPNRDKFNRPIKTSNAVLTILHGPDVSIWNTPTNLIPVTAAQPVDPSKLTAGRAEWIVPTVEDDLSGCENGVCEI